MTDSSVEGCDYKACIEHWWCWCQAGTGALSGPEISPNTDDFVHFAMVWFLSLDDSVGGLIILLHEDFSSEGLLYISIEMHNKFPKPLKKSQFYHRLTCTESGSVWWGSVAGLLLSWS